MKILTIFFLIKIRFKIMNQFHLLVIFCQFFFYGFLYNDKLELNNELEDAIFLIIFFLHNAP
jgi:hypothetical protein